MVSSLLLPVGGPGVSVKVHPVVLLQVCDAFIRRNEKQDRVSGTLLGVATDGVVQVNRCYAVPHNESADQVGAARARWLLAAGGWRGVIPSVRGAY